MDAFVTGASGFLGAHVVRRLLDEGRVTAHVRRKEEADSLPPSAASEVGDVRELSRIPSGAVVVHLAASTFVPDSYRDPSLTFDVNVRGTWATLDAARRADASAFVLASTAHVYGAPTQLPVSEEAALDPRSPYAATKVAAETAALTFARAYGLRVAVLRFFNLYGPGQRGPFLVPALLREMLAGNPVVTGPPEPRRDFLFVADAVEAVRRASLRRGAAPLVVNVGSGTSVSVREMASALATEAGYRGSVTHDASKARPDEILDLRADVARALAELGWRPETSLASGLRATVAWARGPGGLAR